MDPRNFIESPQSPDEGTPPSRPLPRATVSPMPNHPPYQFINYPNPVPQPSTPQMQEDPDIEEVNLIRDLDSRWRVELEGSCTMDLVALATGTPLQNFADMTANMEEALNYMDMIQDLIPAYRHDRPMPPIRSWYYGPFHNWKRRQEIIAQRAKDNIRANLRRFLANSRIRPF